MKRFQNDLGWYFNGVEIRRKYPSKKSLRNRIIKAILTWLIITIITFFGIIAKEGCSPEVALTIIIPLFLIIVIIGILSKFWLLKIITIQRRISSMIINGINIPCYLFNAEIDHDPESGLYKVYLRPSEFLKTDEYSEDWNPLVWESTDAQETAQIVEELRQCGVGEKDFEKQHPVIPGNKKIGIAVFVCWILCLFATRFYVRQSTQSEISNPNSTESLLLLAKTFLIFGLFTIIAFAGYNIWFGLMAIKDRQIPSPRTIFFGEMRLFQGDIAVKCGRKIVVFGVVAIVISLIAGIYFDYKLKEMSHAQNNQQTLTTNQNQ